MTRANDLRADFELLGVALVDAEPAAKASIARERRLIGELLERLEAPSEVPLVDELAVKRTRSGARRPPSRRRKSG